MAIGTGLGSSFGLVAETTYGTYMAPTQWIESTAPELKKVKNTAQGGAMAAGRYARPGAMRVVTSKAAGGSISTYVYSKRMGRLLNGLMGGTVTPTQQAATTAYLQTHALGDPTGKFYTMQIGVPNTAGTANPYTFLGSKITGAEFSCGVDTDGGLLTAKWDVDCRDVTEAQTLAAPSYPTCNVFHFAQATLKLGTHASEASVDGVRKVTVRIERPSATDRFYMGAAGLKSEPLINDFVRISGTVETDFVTKADFADRFASDSSTSMVWEFVGPTIESSYAETFRITIPQVFFNGDTPTVNGPNVVQPSFPFEATYDLTNLPATIAYISTDTSL